MPASYPIRARLGTREEWYLAFVEERIRASLLEAAEAFAVAARGPAAEQVAGIARRVLECFRSGGVVLCCGNGGSMAEAMHFAEECTGRFRLDRDPLPAIAIADPTHFTCAANDYGFESIFERAVRAWGRPGDVLLALSTSGRSENVVRAARAARERGMTVLGLLGGDGGPLLPLCDAAYLPEASGSARIQELHLWAVHAIIDAVERELFEPAGASGG
ncbi:MAG: SIS domain-containing protein [Fimbriimonadales bacterium]